MAKRRSQLRLLPRVRSRVRLSSSRKFTSSTQCIDSIPQIILGPPARRVRHRLGHRQQTVAVGGRNPPQAFHATISTGTHHRFCSTLAPGEHQAQVGVGPVVAHHPQQELVVLVRVGDSGVDDDRAVAQLVPSA